MAHPDVSGPLARGTTNGSIARNIHDVCILWPPTVTAPKLRHNGRPVLRLGLVASLSVAARAFECWRQQRGVALYNAGSHIFMGSPDITTK
jgi:hypothetical protein